MIYSITFTCDEGNERNPDCSIQLSLLYLFDAAVQLDSELFLALPFQYGSPCILGRTIFFDMSHYARISDSYDLLLL